VKVYRSVKEGRGKEKKERYEEEGTGGVRQGIGGWERGDKEGEGKGRRRREVWTPAFTPRYQWVECTIELFARPRSTYIINVRHG